MTIREQLTNDMKTAMKAGDRVSLEAIRFLIAQIKNVEIDQGEQDDAGVQQIITKQIKQMREAIADFERGGRTDLVESEQAKVAVISKYLPAQMSEEEVRVIIQQVKAESPGLAMGPLTGKVMQQLKGKADGSMVARLIQAEMAST